LCAKLALKETDDGDLLIVGDGSQSLYSRRTFTWREAGVNAVGRTINTRFDLDKNYRNTREILKVAAEFVSANAERNDPESGLQIIKPDPNVALRSGPIPEMLTAPTEKHELRMTVEKIDAWLKEGITPSEMAILYRANTGGWVRELATLLSQRTTVYWPHDRSGSFRDRSGLWLSTMHSAKGLQWRAVLLTRSDMMPFLASSTVSRAEQERLERGLMYVAMTRAEERLAFTRSSANGFSSQIQQLLGS
jgi:superfamily I DNA/RNA helicase